MPNNQVYVQSLQQAQETLNYYQTINISADIIGVNTSNAQDQSLGYSLAYPQGYAYPSIPEQPVDAPESVRSERDRILEIFSPAPPRREECYPRRMKFKRGKKVRLIDPDKVYRDYKLKTGDIGIIVDTYRSSNKEFEVTVEFRGKQIHFMDKYLALVSQDKKPAWF